MTANDTAATQTERLRVLKMLEERKITAEECAELLDALSIKTPLQTARQRFRARLMIVAGLILILAGFLMPWFGGNFNSAQKALRDEPKLGMAEVLMLRLSPVVSYEEIMRQMMGEADKIQQSKIQETQVRLSFPGHMVKNGLGWLILALGLAAGLICFGMTGIRGAIQRNAALSLLALGAFMIFYLVLQASGFIGLGLVVVSLGYGIEAAGVIIRYRQAA